MYGTKLGLARKLRHKSLNALCMGHMQGHTREKLQQFQIMEYPNSVPVNKVGRLKKSENT